MLGVLQQRRRLLPRRPSLFSFLFLLVLIGIPTQLLWQHQVAANAEQDAIRQIWQRVQTKGAYSFRADISQITIPAATVTNIGATGRRHDLRIEGATDLEAETMQMTLWGQGGSVLDAASGLQLKTEAGRLWARQGNEAWEEAANFTDALIPQGDFTSFLAGATDVQLVVDEATSKEPAESTMTRYRYRIDGQRFAVYLREQVQAQMQRDGELAPGTKLELPAAITAMQGSGELWVDANGLPRRQVVDLTFPAGNGAAASEETKATIKVSFDFGETAAAPTGTTQWANPVAGLAQMLDTTLTTPVADPDHPLWHWLLVSTTLVGASGLLVLVVVRRRSRPVYTGVVVAVIITLSCRRADQCPDLVAATRWQRCQDHYPQQRHRPNQTDTLPAGLTFVAGGSSPQCSANGATVTCPLGFMAEGDLQTLTIRAQVGNGAATTLVNQAVVGARYADSNPANNSVTFSDVTLYPAATPIPGPARYLYWGDGFRLRRERVDSPAAPETLLDYPAITDTTAGDLVIDS